MVDHVQNLGNLGGALVFFFCDESLYQRPLRNLYLNPTFWGPKWPLLRFVAAVLGSSRGVTGKCEEVLQRGQKMLDERVVGQISVDHCH